MITSKIVIRTIFSETLLSFFIVLSIGGIFLVWKCKNTLKGIKLAMNAYQKGGWNSQPEVNIPKKRVWK